MTQPPTTTLQTLRDLPAVVEPYFRSIPVDKIDLRRTADAWTLREHLYHVAKVQAMLLGRMKLLRDDPNPVIVPYFPQNEPALADQFTSVDGALSEYRTRRSEQMTLLEALSPEQWSKPGVHPEYERYDLALVVHHLVFHEYWHFYRIEELWLTRDGYLS